MAFELPVYHEPDFGASMFRNAPDAQLAEVEMDGVAPEGFHSTSMYPESNSLDNEGRSRPS